VPALEDTKGDGKPLTLREQMTLHRTQQPCAGCHKIMDPIGFSLENFDATGRWRIKDGEFAVDATGVMYDGTRLDGPAGLRDALLAHKDAFLLSFTEALMTYALGRRIEATDMPAVRRIIRDAARDGYRMSSFIRGIVDSAAFQMSTVMPVETTR
jgi:hypothetical protein